MVPEWTEATGQHACVWPYTVGHVNSTPPFSRLFAQRWTVLAGQLVLSRQTDESGSYLIWLNEICMPSSPIEWLAKQNTTLSLAAVWTSAFTMSRRTGLPLKQRRGQIFSTIQIQFYSGGNLDLTFQYKKQCLCYKYDIIFWTNNSGSGTSKMFICISVMARSQVDFQ